MVLCLGADQVVEQEIPLRGRVCLKHVDFGSSFSSELALNNSMFKYSSVKTEPLENLLHQLCSELVREGYESIHAGAR